MRVAASLIVLTLLAVAAAVSEPPERFEQDRFAIGFWVDPPMDEQADARYQEIAEANFTLALGGFGANTREKVVRQLELCQKYGLKALVTSHGMATDELPDGPACWGYMIRDEPNVADFPALRQRLDEIRAARPGKLGFINLFPNYANARQLGAPTYDEHVAQFMEVVGTDVLSMDHYPVMKPGGDSRASYCANLEVMRKHALEHGVPFWNFFNCMPFGPHADPTEAQLRWQIYTSIAYGAKGVLYFCYYTPLSHEFPKGGAIIARDGRPTRHYLEAKRINAAVKNLGPTLMRLTSTAVYRLTPDDEPAEILAGSGVRDLGRADHDPKHDFLAGAFRHEDGRRALLLNNYRHDFAAWPTVVFDCAAEDVREVCKKTGHEIDVLDDSPDMDGLQLSFDAGEGRLFLLPAP